MDEELLVVTVDERDHAPEWAYLCLIILPLMIILGNVFVLFAVLVDRKLRATITNKFIASLAVSDLLLGIVVTPVAVYIKASQLYPPTHNPGVQVNNDQWPLGAFWCRMHLCTTVFTTTASIVHLVAISCDRYMTYTPKS
jgi:hypothetical protein